MNRKRRKAIKLARKHGRDIYTARNPFWQARPITERAGHLDMDTLRAAFDTCISSQEHEIPVTVDTLKTRRNTDC
jgi:molybdopterin/thiamine biosynthesis adenylyltransferase